MKIEQAFTVSRPPEEVWALFQDVPEVVRCMPGAELLEELGDDRYRGRVSVRLGAIQARFEGEARRQADPERRSGTIEGEGLDRRGGSRGRVRLAYRVAPVAPGAEVVLDADVTLSGPAAQFGRPGLVRELSGRLIQEFAECLEGKLEAETPTERGAVRAREIRGLRLLLASFWGLVRGWLGRLAGRGGSRSS